MDTIDFNFMDSPEYGDLANIYAKLHVNNRVSAIQEAMRRRILDYNP